MTKKYAHSLEGKPPSEWQPLEHLQNVAEMARSFSIALTVRIEFVWWGYEMI